MLTVVCLPASLLPRHSRRRTISIPRTHTHTHLPMHVQTVYAKLDAHMHTHTHSCEPSETQDVMTALSQGEHGKSIGRKRNLSFLSFFCSPLHHASLPLSTVLAWSIIQNDELLIQRNIQICFGNNTPFLCYSLLLGFSIDMSPTRPVFTPLGCVEWL